MSHKQDSHALLLSVGLSLLIGLLFIAFLSYLDRNKNSRNEYLLLASGMDAFNLISSEHPDRTFPLESPFTHKILAVNLPADLAKMPAPEKRSVFVSLLIPHIVKANRSIQEERNHLLTLESKINKFGKLTYPEEKALKKLSRKYGLEQIDFDELKKRIDSIPLSLALAQAILETGWGTSRFAIEGNALFGIHSPYDANQKHMVSSSGQVRVTSYACLADSVSSYFRLLNSARPYKKFRTLRFDLKRNTRNASGYDLAGGLTNYSEIGSLYAERLRAIIAQYSLGEFEDQIEVSTSTVQEVRFSRRG